MLKTFLIIILTFISVVPNHLIAETGSSTKLVKEENSLVIYPNPVTNEFWIEGIEKGSLVQLFNENNELVYEVICKGGSGSTGNVGGINPIPSGLYTVISNGQTGTLIKIED